MDQAADRRIIDGLRRGGFRVTPQRLAICRQILADRNHPSPSAVFEAVRRTHSAVRRIDIHGLCRRCGRARKTR
ncbi:MAG: hypothetical protein FJ149_10435 [Euryarchaeota archaeon]|nr:hypothetical protein [Euryarchaeota archaeon]